MVEATSLTSAWVDAFLSTYDNGNTSPLVVTIGGFTGMPPEDAQVRASMDQLLMTKSGTWRSQTTGRARVALIEKDDHWTIMSAAYFTAAPAFRQWKGRASGHVSRSSERTIEVGATASGGSRSSIERSGGADRLIQGCRRKTPHDGAFGLSVAQSVALRYLKGDPRRSAGPAAGHGSRLDIGGAQSEIQPVLGAMPDLAQVAVETSGGIASCSALRSLRVAGLSTSGFLGGRKA